MNEFVCLVLHLFSKWLVFLAVLISLIDNFTWQFFLLISYSSLSLSANFHFVTLLIMISFKTIALYFTTLRFFYNCNAIAWDLCMINISREGGWMSIIELLFCLVLICLSILFCFFFVNKKTHCAKIQQKSVFVLLSSIFEFDGISQESKHFWWVNFVALNFLNLKYKAIIWWYSFHSIPNLTHKALDDNNNILTYYVKGLKSFRYNSI